MRRFLDTYLYTEPAFLVDEITKLDAEQRTIEAVMDTTRPLPLAPLQRVSPLHPAHVTGSELIMLTGNLGSLHAWFFHGCRWDEGWSGFGNRIHRADFKSLCRIGPPLRLESKEIRTRAQAQRVVLRYEFRYWQEERLVYFGDQSAIFVKEKDLDE